MADGASLARKALSGPSGFDNLWVMHVGVPVPAPGRGQCMVGVEPGLDLGGREALEWGEASQSLLGQGMPPGLGGFHQMEGGGTGRAPCSLPHLAQVSKL